MPTDRSRRFSESIVKIKREGARIEIMHGAVGGINENDVKLAEVTEAVVVGFNVRPDGKTRRLAEEKGIEIRTYGIIYELLEELEQMLVGRLAPDEVEAVLGTAEVRAVFKVPRIGAIAGCYVTEGEIVRNARARLLRNGVVVFDGVIGPCAGSRMMSAASHPDLSAESVWPASTTSRKAT